MFFLVMVAAAESLPVAWTLRSFRGKSIYFFRYPEIYSVLVSEPSPRTAGLCAGHAHGTDCLPME